MALAREVMGGGFAAGGAKALNGQINSAITAAGTVISTPPFSFTVASIAMDIIS